MSARLGTAELEAALVAATGRLADIDSSLRDTDVASCPGWTIQRLILHVGRIHRWVAVALDSPEGQDVPAVARPAPDADLATWLRAGASHLVGAFHAAGDHGRISSPGWEQPAGWWLRRCALETTLHAWDAQAAVGAPSPIPVTLALTGIGEVMEVFAPYGIDRTAFAGPASIVVHCTDAHRADVDLPDTWTIHVAPDVVTAVPGEAGNDVVVRAPASDVLLLLWNRLDHRHVEVAGDRGLLDTYRQAACF